MDSLFFSPGSAESQLSDPDIGGKGLGSECGQYKAGQQPVLECGAIPPP